MASRTPGDIEVTGTLPTAGVFARREGGRGPDPLPWVDEARAGIEEPGKYLAYEDSGRQLIVPVAREWTRIGRSMSADVRFDDATVSRRHALIVAQADGVRVLDDRSLNGVYVNGRRVEWSPLKDGDQIVVGRHMLVFLDTATVGQPVAAASPTLAE